MDLLIPGFGLVFWQVLIWIILIFFLAKFAWKPIVQSLRIREESIQEALDAAVQAKEEMAKIKSDNEKILEEAKMERDKIIKEARDASNLLREEAKTEASAISVKMLADAKAAINTEKQAALTEVKNQVALLSLEIAEKLVKKHLGEEKAQKELVRDFVKDLNLN